MTHCHDTCDESLQGAVTTKLVIARECPALMADGDPVFAGAVATMLVIAPKCRTMTSDVTSPLTM